MRYILAGPDDFSLKARLAEIKAGLGDPQMLETATSVLDGDRLNPNDLRLALNTVPFLAPARLVIVSGLLARFKPSGESGSKATKSKKKPVDTESSLLKDLAAAIMGSPPSTVLVLVENGAVKTNPLFKEIQSGVKLEEFPQPSKPALKEWLGRRVTECGGHITPPAINLLAQYVGADLWTAAAEVEKLTLYAGNRPITEDDVRLLTGNSQEASIFNLVDAVFEQRPKDAMAALESLKSGGVSAGYILAMIARQLRLVIQVKDLKARKEKDTDIRRLLGLTHDFVWNKTVQQATRQTLPRFREIYRNLVETDIAVKTGKLDEITAIDLLVAELAASK
ncbi:DNA polymerase III, delta subunit [Dehalogenimonas lykanthroporepellens BL-DC-9]|nr:DNA polymerase III, delta subunit [Dehalogenimonas lykanthroporepellens BL-DC-9]